MLTVLLFTVSLSGCQSFKTTVDKKFINSSLLSSLSSNVSLAYIGSERSISGSGVLMYQKPDKIHMIILSPFGSVLQEVYVSGEIVTIVDTGNGVAFSGNYNNLPLKGDFSAWRHIHWLIDIDPPDSSRHTGDIKRINRFGNSESAVFKDGFLLSKSTEIGGIVKYADYNTVNGVSFPLKIEYETISKEKFTLLLDAPDINLIFDSGIFKPDLNKYRLYPLSILK